MTRDSFIWNQSTSMTRDSFIWNQSTLMTRDSFIWNHSLENTNETRDHIFETPSWAYTMMSVIYACIFLIGVTGNSLVILVITKDRRMRNTANFYLISLSFADLMIIVCCLPVAAYELHSEEVWNLGPQLCRLAPLLQYLSTNASISTMVAISIERYIVICRPFKVRTYCTKRRAFGIIMALWAFSLACSFPFFLFTVHTLEYHQKLGTHVHVCYINQASNEIYFFLHQAIFYVIPGFMLSLLYCAIIGALRRFKSERFAHSPDSRRNAGPGGRSKSDSSQQLILMLSSVVLCYFVCLFPYNFITFMSLITHETLLELGPVAYNVLLAVSRIMFFLNSCTNPILYNAISGKFRDAFSRLFRPSRYHLNERDSRICSIRSGHENRFSEYPSTSRSSGIRKSTKRTTSGGDYLEAREYCGSSKNASKRSDCALVVRSSDRCGRRVTEPQMKRDIE